MDTLVRVTLHTRHVTPAQGLARCVGQRHEGFWGDMRWRRYGEGLIVIDESDMDASMSRRRNGIKGNKLMKTSFIILVISVLNFGLAVDNVLDHKLS